MPAGKTLVARTICLLMLSLQRSREQDLENTVKEFLAELSVFLMSKIQREVELL